MHQGYEGDDLPEVVYHSSATAGLRTIEPRVGTHRKPWVYATIDLGISAIFLAHEGRDLSCASGLSNGEVYLYERWAGAFERRYGGKSGSIYELPGSQFERGRTSFSGEVTSDRAATVLSETRVADASKFILKLADSGRIRVLMHADRPSWIPADDGDLVEQVARIMRQNPKAGSLQYAKRHLPHVVARVEAKMRSVEAEPT